jgi:hypothetical protein
MLETTRLQLSAFSFSCLLLGSGITSHAQPNSQQISEHLKSKQVFSCIKIDSVNNEYIPPLLYVFMNSCIKEGKYADAVYFFALAGTYTSYDTKRVADVKTHQAHSLLLQEFFAVLNKPQLDKLFKELNKTLGDKTKLPTICAKIKSIGAPDYYPKYMINYGDRAVTGQKKADPKQPADQKLIPNFDAKAAWEKSLNVYLHCPSQAPGSGK